MAGKNADRSRLNWQISASAACISGLRRETASIAASADAVISALKHGRKILTAGNGCSAAEALHMAEEFVGRFRSNRRSLPAVALTADCTALTCIGDDFGFDAVFSRQVEGLGNAGDVLVLFSTSGRAANLLNAVKVARKHRMVVVCVLGRDGGALAGLADHEIIVAGDGTERIQEAHQVIMHLILDAVETAFQ